MSLEGDISKGTRASFLLKSDIYQESVGGVRKAIMDLWAKSPIRDTEGQHELRLMLKLLDDLEGHIVSMANTGKLAQKQLEHEKTLKDRAKAALQGLISR